MTFGFEANSGKWQSDYMSWKRIILAIGLLLIGVACVFFIFIWSPCADCGIRQPVKTAKLQLHEFGLALREYKSICGKFPSNAEGLEVLAQPITCNGRNESQLVRNLAADPWKRKWLYESQGDEFKVYTLGADGMIGGGGGNTDFAITNSDVP